MNEIKYERNFTGSYMKIMDEKQTQDVDSLKIDERIILKNKINGLLSVEKFYIDGKGEFWYNITGKQSLDTFCQVKEIGLNMIERIITSVCSEIELLEMRLLDVNGLRLEPALIFVSNSSQEIVFTFYPTQKVSLDLAFQQLMEYLLTRIDHKDAECVKAAYDLYERSLDDGYSIMDIRDYISQTRRKNVESNINNIDKTVERIENHIENDVERHIEIPKESIQEELQIGGINEKQKQRLSPKVEKIFGKLVENKKVINNYVDFSWINILKEWISKKGKKSNQEKKVRVIYPDDIKEEVVKKQIHPTVCLSDYREHPEGLLLYEGYDGFANIRIEKENTRFGKGDSSEVDVSISKDTVSRIHACIEKEGTDYYIVDLNSTNGTYVNDQIISYKERKILKSNDIIRFGDVKYRFI